MTYPIWLEWLIPLTWTVIFPVNFFMNLLVLVLTMKYLRVSNRKQNVKAVILRVWVMEGAANLIGTTIMLIITQFDFHNKSYIWQTHSKHYPQWWKIESISSKLRKKTRVPTFTTSIQHSILLFNNILGKWRADTWYVAKKITTCCIEVYTNCIDTALNSIVQCLM